MISSNSLLRGAVYALGLAAASWAVVMGQDTVPFTGTRALVRDIGLPGIDRGLRPQDMPPDPSQPPLEAMRADRSTPGPTDIVPGGVIVKFKPGADRTTAVAATLSQVSGTSADRPSWANFEILTLPADDDPERAASELRARADVEYAQPRYRVRKAFRPNDPFYPDQWNFPALDMERAWDIQLGATSEVVVAVLDSGVAFRTATFRYNSRFPFRLTSGGPVYPALGIVDVPFAAAPELGDSPRFVSPRDFIWNDTDPVDLDGHGTHVAGTIGQLTNNAVGVAGMAFNVRLMPVKVLDEVWDFVFGAPESGSDDTVARAIRYAADSGAKVINMSFGRHSGGPAPVVDDALRYAVGRGVFVAIASGNTRDTGNEPNRIGLVAPSLDGCVVVGAVGRSLEVAFYSTSGSAVELSAPGGDTRQAGEPAGAILQQTLEQDQLATYTLPPSQFRPPRADIFAYYFTQGTSMAAPHVSGFAALLVQQGIADPAAIEEAMKRFATDKGPAGRDDDYGVGLINPRATLRGLGLAR
jgi:serine protease